MYMTGDRKEMAEKMEQTAKGPFAAVYPAVAQQICAEEAGKQGVCLDIGSGGGQLGIEIGKISDFRIVAFDKNPYALEYAKNNAEEEEIQSRFTTLCGDVHQIPLENNSVDLCVSRGSMWFWEDGKKAFSEIYRVLKPGATAYIGCSFGTDKVLDSVIEKMKTFLPTWNEERIKRFRDNPVSKFENFLKEAGITDYSIQEEYAGRIIMIHKS